MSDGPVEMASRQARKGSKVTVRNSWPVPPPPCGVHTGLSGRSVLENSHSRTLRSIQGREAVAYLTADHGPCKYRVSQPDSFCRGFGRSCADHCRLPERLAILLEHVKAVPAETDLLWCRQGDRCFPVQLILRGGADVWLNSSRNQALSPFHSDTACSKFGRVLRMSASIPR